MITKKSPVKRKKTTDKPLASKKTAKQQKKVKKAPVGDSYNQVKRFQGQQYTGMQIGRSHHWDYDKGDWIETKITPDLWEISFNVTKRRKGRGAPEGSGVPLGTEYHWYILANQTAKKLNANDYSTSMHGLKFKLAHKRADKHKWSVTGPTQRKHLIKFLKDFIAQLEKDPVPLEFDYKDSVYKGEGIPIEQTCRDGVCYELDITLNDESMGIIRCTKSGWKMDGIEQGLVDAIGNEVFLYFE